METKDPCLVDQMQFESFVSVFNGKTCCSPGYPAPWARRQGWWAEQSPIVQGEM